MGGDPAGVDGVFWCTMFQSTPPRGGRPAISRYLRRLLRFQSTPPRGGRRPYRVGAVPRVERVSIHAPAWGATLRPQWAVWRLKQFQSTPPRGGRQWEEYTRRSSTSVSIHAPAWGATPVPEIACDSEEFQSTPPRGGRPLPLRSGVNRVTSFNPRPRVGGDGAGRPRRQAGRTSFNPRPRVGGDFGRITG